MHLEVSAVFPAYNEEKNIRTFLEQARRVLSRYFQNWEIFVVDDGSSDRTGDIVLEISRIDPRVKLISHSQNQGYGQALRTGFSRAQYGLIFFSDSDGQFDLEEIRLFFPYLPRAEIVSGFRLRRADPWYRSLNAWGYNKLAAMVFGLKVKDINCAFKFIRREILDAMELESRGALINAEILYKAAKNKFRVAEIGVHHFPRRHGSQTGANPRVVLRMFKELIRWRIKWGGIVYPGQRIS